MEDVERQPSRRTQMLSDPRQTSDRQPPAQWRLEWNWDVRRAPASLNTYQLQLPSGRDVESRVNIKFARTRRARN